MQVRKLYKVRGIKGWTIVDSPFLLQTQPEKHAHASSINKNPVQINNHLKQNILKQQPIIIQKWKTE